MAPKRLSKSKKIEKEVRKLLSIKNFKVIINEPVPNAYSAPFKVYMDLTFACQAKCPFCLYTNTGKNKTQSLNWELCKKTIKEAGKVGVFAFKFGGGEPLLYPYFWQAVKIARQNNIFVSTSTNSYSITNKEIRMLKKYHVKISVSIEGLKKNDEKLRGEGHFDRAVETVKTFKNEGIDVRFQTNVTSRTIKEIPLLVELAKKIGVKIKLRYIKPIGRAGINNFSLKFTDADRYLKLITFLNRKDILPWVDLDESLMLYQPKEISLKLYNGIMCGAANRTLHINPHGEVRPCIFLGDKFLAGKININNSLMDFWRGKNSSAFLKVRKLLPPKECFNCERICFNECPSLRIIGRGSNKKQGVNCLKEMMRHASPNSLKEFRQLLNK